MILSQNNARREISDKIAMATTTFYNPNNENDVYRSALAKNVVREATELGYAVIVVDGGSSDELLREFERYGARVYTESSKGMGNGRRQAIREAYNTGKDIIAWTEPEKEDYILKIVDTSFPVLNCSADLVVPRRKSMQSYPTAQQYAEPLGNAFWREVTGADLDVLFGPRTWRRELSDYFLNYDGEYGDKWDSIFIPVMNAIFDGKRVSGVEVEYTHPRGQTEMEEHNIHFYRKRLEQLENLMTSLEMHQKKLRFSRPK